MDYGIFLFFTTVLVPVLGLPAPEILILNTLCEQEETIRANWLKDIHKIHIYQTPFPDEYSYRTVRFLTFREGDTYVRAGNTLGEYFYLRMKNHIVPELFTTGTVA